MTHTILRENIQEVERAVKVGGGGRQQQKQKNRGCFVATVGWAQQDLLHFLPLLGHSVPPSRAKHGYSDCN